MTFPCYQKIQLCNIDDNNFWNLHYWSNDIPKTLEQSLDKFGILHPPLLMEENSGKMTLLAGKRRIEWAKKKKLAALFCAVYPITEYRTLLATVIEEQKLSKELNIAEKAYFVKIAQKLSLSTDIMNDICSLLQIKKSPALLKSLSHLVEEPNFLLQKIDNGEISFQIYEELKRLKTDKERDSLLQLFADLQLGNSKQRRILQLLKEYAYAKNMHIDTLLCDKEIIGIISHTQEKNKNNPQKIQHLMWLLEKLMNPVSVVAERDFQEGIKDLNLPNNYRIHHSPAFEKDEIRLEISFTNFHECSHFIKKYSDADKK